MVVTLSLVLFIQFSLVIVFVCLFVCLFMLMLGLFSLLIFSVSCGCVFLLILVCFLVLVEFNWVPCLLIGCTLE